MNIFKTSPVQPKTETPPTLEKQLRPEDKRLQEIFKPGETVHVYSSPTLHHEIEGILPGVVIRKHPPVG